ncbi:MAG TPA: NAD(P)H-binding protein [Terracidiphilus sp.]|nr:NAD(P)H-binding protein [Terracidiphilus sp.]
MKVLIFGATGMVGQGVLRECLRDPDVELAVTIGRSPAGEQNLGLRGPNLREVIHHDLTDLSAIEGELAGFDACFFSLGVSSSGMKEADYERITYDLTLAAAQTLSRLNPGMTFIYVSGAGTDSAEQGRIMWARVKGRTENALLRLPLLAYMFRPGIIQPLDGIQSKTLSYRVLYGLMKPLLPLLRWALPNFVLSTRDIGLAMLAVAKHGYEKRILETKDIRALAGT